MALHQQGTETFLSELLPDPVRDVVLMALPQQGTETFSDFVVGTATGLFSVNGLTPTGDGNKEVTIMGDIVVLG